jgi:membrane-associated phospholipid phosphatase
MLRDRHKARREWAILIAGAVLAAPAGLQAQVPDSIPAVTIRDAVLSGVASVLLITPRAAGWGTGLPDCAPCDRLDVPPFDRWAIGQYRSGWQWASNIGVVALAAFITTDLARRQDGARTVAALEAGLWAAGLTEVFKAAVGRPRPVLYTLDAPAAANDAGSARSFPSGHTSVAFAFATTYWLARKDLDGKPGVLGWLALGVAAGVGVSRVAAAKHFPSDVLAGAVLGTASGLVVYQLKF